MSSIYRKNVIAVKFFSCIALVAALLYAHISRQNELTALRLKIPLLAKELKEIEEENHLLQYMLCRFESPENMWQQRRLARFSHLTMPYSDQILMLEQPEPFKLEF